MLKDNFYITKTDYNEVFPIWRSELWPKRESQIEPISIISHIGSKDDSIKNSQPYFFKAVHESKIVGVISGFMTSESHFRTRGVWVLNSTRHLGIGTKLIQQNLEKAKELKATVVWSMARHSAITFYSKNGFEIYLNTDEFEYGPHCFVKKNYIK